MLAAAVSMIAMGVIALATALHFVFPSLGPTAYLIYATPNAPAAQPRNAVFGHLIGALAGYLALVVFGLTERDAALVTGFDAARAGAAALSLGLTAGVMVWLDVPHPPAGATTLIVSLGILHRPSELVVLMAAVCILVAIGVVFNSLAGVRYPRWSAMPAQTSTGPGDRSTG